MASTSLRHSTMRALRPLSVLCGLLCIWFQTTACATQSSRDASQVPLGIAESPSQNPYGFWESPITTEVVAGPKVLVSCLPRGIDVTNLTAG